MPPPAPTSGFIAIGSNDGHPQGVFLHVGDSTDVSGRTWPIIGFPIFQDGTISKLVVSGFTITTNSSGGTTGTRFQCTNLSATAPVTDGQLVEPWLDVASGTVTLAVGSTSLPLACSLNMPASAISSVTVQWTKT